jgi:hypothetical protein
MRLFVCVFEQTVEVGYFGLHRADSLGKWPRGVGACLFRRKSHNFFFRSVHRTNCIFELIEKNTFVYHYLPFAFRELFPRPSWVEKSFGNASRRGIRVASCVRVCLYFSAICSSRRHIVENVQTGSSQSNPHCRYATSKGGLSSPPCIVSGFGLFIILFAIMRAI